MNSWAAYLWSDKGKVSYLMIAASILFLGFLGMHGMWTQEHRWADIVSGMFYRHDFLHPYLHGQPYYDKPLLSYWLIAGASYLMGGLSLLTLRLPSALAGLLAIWSIYRIGTHLKDKQLGLLAGWLLLTTFYFIFWARTSSADMLNVGGILFAVSWYLEQKEQPGFLNYAIFFLILAFTALCKGLVGVIVPCIAIFPDLIINKGWKKHCRVSLLLAILPAALIYYAPFWASAYFGAGHYEQNGLTLVYRENILRYFQPFDHKGPIYTYFIFLPIYLLPWAIFFIPAIFSLRFRWSKMSVNTRWIVWVVFLIFLFFTLSGSRRNYYILPVVPFAILMTADWILSNANNNRLAGKIVAIFFIVFFLIFDVIQPFFYVQGMQNFIRL